jgi:hypothetical protein
MDASSPLPAADGLTLEVQLQVELRRLFDLCDALAGAAVATNDGLVLGALGSLLPETASATAAFVLNELDAHLGVLRAARTQEIVVWTDAGPWYFARIGGLPFVIVLFARPEAPAGMLRHAGSLAASRLTPALAALASA